MPAEESYLERVSGNVRWETPRHTANDDNSTRVTISSAGYMTLLPDEPLTAETDVGIRAEVIFSPRPLRRYR